MRVSYWPGQRLASPCSSKLRVCGYKDRALLCVYACSTPCVYVCGVYVCVSVCVCLCVSTPSQPPSKLLKSHVLILLCFFNGFLFIYSPSFILLKSRPVLYRCVCVCVCACVQLEGS